jgi:hypothetical protein
MKIWTVLFNDDAGPSVETYNSQLLADDAAWDWVQDYWTTNWQMEDTPPAMPEDWQEAYEYLQENMTMFIDSVHVEEHDVHPPQHPDDSIEEILIDYVPDRSDGDLEVDDNALVSFGEDAGAYVQCWKWISWDHIDDLPMVIQLDELTWYFDSFEQFMEAWGMAPESAIYAKGTPELLEVSGGTNDAEEFEGYLNGK